MERMKIFCKKKKDCLIFFPEILVEFSGLKPLLTPPEISGKKSGGKNRIYYNALQPRAITVYNGETNKTTSQVIY